MSYMPGAGRAMADYLEASAECEELDLPKGEFIAKMGKAYKIALSIVAFVSLVIGIPTTFIWHEDVGIIFLILGIVALLVLPTIISYRCIVNKISLKEEYLVLFIKLKKEVLWDSVKYRKITTGNNKSIKLYDANGKRLMSFDSATVGFGRIVKMAKRSAIRDYNKKDEFGFFSLCKVRNCWDNTKILVLRNEDFSFVPQGTTSFDRKSTSFRATREHHFSFLRHK